MTSNSTCSLFLFGLVIILYLSDVSQATVLKEEKKMTPLSTMNSSPLSISSHARVKNEINCNDLQFQEIIGCVCFLRDVKALPRPKNWKRTCYCKNRYDRPCMEDLAEAKSFCASIGGTNVQKAKNKIKTIKKKCGKKPEKFI